MNKSRRAAAIRTVFSLLDNQLVDAAVGIPEKMIAHSLHVLESDRLTAMRGLVSNPPRGANPYTCLEVEKRTAGVITSGILVCPFSSAQRL